MDNLNFTYKRLSEDNFKDLQYLFLNVFNKRKTIHYLKNKYNTSYLGIKNICFLAYHNDKPVAFYGAIPQKFTSNSSTILAAHACDSFTLKEYQNKGLHYNLALKSYDLMRTEGIKMVYAYHSENTYYSTKKLSWLEHKKMQRFHLKTPTLPLAKIAKKTHLNSLYLNICNRYLRKFETIYTNPDPSCKFKQNYTSDFIQYKNNFNQHYFINLCDYNFWIKIDSVLHVGFFSTKSDQKFELAVKKLKKIATILGINEILFQVLTDSKEYDLLSKITNAKPSWLIGYLPFEPINIDDFEFNYADLDTF